MVFLLVTTILMLIIAVAYGSIYFSGRRTDIAEVALLAAIVISPIGLLPVVIVLGVTDQLSWIAEIPVLGDYLLHMYTLWDREFVSVFVVLWTALSALLWGYVIHSVWRSWDTSRALPKS